MNRSRSTIVVRLLAPVCGLLSAGCLATFSQQDAHEVSRERLVQLSEIGKSDHLVYEGSDGGYHYVFDSRPDKGRSYKIRADQMPLRDTFRVGEDSYVLHPWVIEGKMLGSKTEDPITNAPPAEDDH